MQCQELMKQDIYNSMTRVSVNIDQMQAFVIIDNVGMMISAGVNAKNSLIKAYAIKDLFVIQMIANVNAIKHVILVSIQTIKVVRVRKIS